MEHSRPDSNDGAAPDAGDLARAATALAECERLVARLDAGCCDPGRSPQMQRLGSTLDEARAALGVVTDEPSAQELFTRLEDMGGQLGRLQVSCCTPKRMPLYADLLVHLTDAQLAVNRALGTGH